jgi:hypothetical protein
MGRIIGDGGCLFQIADGEAHHLYRKFGFTDTAPESIGMACFIGAD